jgi:DNA repair exonuclease SbcCD ATPase subunit
VLVTLVDKDLVRVRRISQDRVRVRVSAGSNSFRREERLQQLLVQTRQQVLELRKQVESPAQSAALTARQRSARQRAAELQRRLEQAIAQLSELKQRQAEAAQRAGQGKWGDQTRAREPRMSTTDAAARVMKMANGGYNPAVNVQLDTDTQSRAILGVEVSPESSDSAGLSEPMRQQVEQRTVARLSST